MDTPVGNLTIELPEGVVTEVLSINAICRLCGNQSEKLTGIYSEDGIRDELANKINSYLPIKVCETDELPLQCCWNCVSALLTWHNLLILSLVTDRRLKSYQLITEKQLTTIDYKAENGSSSEDSNEKGSSQTTTSLPAFCQSPTQVSDFCKVKKLEDMGYKVEEGEEVEINQYFATNCDDETTPDDLSEGLEDYIAIPSSFALQENVQALEESPDDQEKVDVGPADVKTNRVAAEDDKLIDYNFMCQDCPALFLHERDILNHVTEVHPETEASRPFGKRKHTKIDPEVVNAAKVEVEGRVYYNCKQCGKSLHSPYTYIWHMRIHTGERPYVCDLCGKQFRVSQGLVRHLRETHEGIKNFPCDICGRMFATRRNVEEHRRIHTNERPYICDLCGKAFKQKASLFVHNRSHNNLFPFKCTYCNQGFRTKPPLLIHITRHTGEKPYPCDICGRCFRIKYELKRHRLIHSDEKPFVCTLCGLTFRQKRYLRNHNKINHNRTIS